MGGRRGLVVSASDCGEGGPQFESRSRQLEIKIFLSALTREELRLRPRTETDHTRGDKLFGWMGARDFRARAVRRSKWLRRSDRGIGPTRTE